MGSRPVVVLSSFWRARIHFFTFGLREMNPKLSNGQKRRLRSDFGAVLENYPQAELNSDPSGWTVSLPIPEDESLTINIPNTWPFSEPIPGSSKFNFSYTSGYEYTPLTSLLKYIQPFIDKIRIYPQDKFEGPAIVEAVGAI